MPATGQTISYAAGDDGALAKGTVWPTPRFVDNGDQTMTDNVTNLVWTKDGNAPGPNTCGPATTKTWYSPGNTQGNFIKLHSGRGIAKRRRRFVLILS